MLSNSLNEAKAYLLAEMLNKEATSEANALATTELCSLLQTAYKLSNVTGRLYVRSLKENGYIQEGLKRGRICTYYVTQSGYLRIQESVATHICPEKTVPEPTKEKKVFEKETEVKKEVLKEPITEEVPIEQTTEENIDLTQGYGIPGINEKDVCEIEY